MIQRLQVFTSERDIAAGTRWANVLDENLAKVTFGIVCVTEENIKAPWLNFEAGGMANAISRPRVTPVLIGLGTSDVTAPLSLLNMVTADRAGIWRLVQSLNEAEHDIALPVDILTSTFDAFWNRIEDAITAAKGMPTEQPSAGPRPIEEMVEEILNIVRSQPILGPSATIGVQRSEAPDQARSGRIALQREIRKRARDEGLSVRPKGYNFIIDGALGIRLRYYTNMSNFLERVRSVIESTQSYFAEQDGAIVVIGIETWSDMTEPCTIADRLGVGFAVFDRGRFSTTEIAQSLAPWLSDSVFVDDPEPVMDDHWNATDSHIDDARQ